MLAGLEGLTSADLWPAFLWQLLSFHTSHCDGVTQRPWSNIFPLLASISCSCVINLIILQTPILLFQWHPMWSCCCKNHPFFSPFFLFLGCSFCLLAFGKQKDVIAEQLKIVLLSACILMGASHWIVQRFFRSHCLRTALLAIHI